MSKTGLLEVNYPYSKQLREVGIKTASDLAHSVLSGNFIGLKYCSFDKIVDWLYVNDYISGKEKEFILKRHEVVRDIPGISYKALSDDKYRAEILYSNFIDFVVNTLELPEYYSYAVLICYLCYYKEDLDYYLHSKLSVIGSKLEVKEKCNTIYEYVYNAKKTDEVKYKMLKYLASGIGYASIKYYTGVTNIQGYYKRLVAELSLKLFHTRLDYNSYSAILYKRLIQSFDSWKNIKTLNFSSSTYKQLRDLNIKLIRDLLYRYCEGSLILSEKSYNEVEKAIVQGLKNNL